MPRFQLARAVHACATDQGAVFLDLAHDCYIGLDAEQSRALADLVEGWPESSMEAPAGRALLAQGLLAQGLLVEAPAGRAHEAPPLPRAREELIAWECMPPARVRVGHVFTFLRALLTVLIVLRGRSLQAMVRRCERRRRCYGSRFDPERTRLLLTLYSTIRLFVFARRGRCLLDTFVLIEFLAAYGSLPSAVIGVQVRPFAAHAWVQEGERVLNGTVPFVRGFLPILVI